MLQVDPLGLASRWKPGGPFAVMGGDAVAGMSAIERYTRRSSTAKKANKPISTRRNDIA